MLNLSELKGFRVKRKHKYKLSDLPGYFLYLVEQTNIEIILDPEESEYIVPNDGFTGFLVIPNRLVSEQDDFFIGCGFHNMVRISAAVGMAKRLLLFSSS